MSYTLIPPRWEGTIKVADDRHLGVCEFGPADVALVSISCILETRDLNHIGEIERLLRDAHACRIAEGTSQIQRLLLGREIAARAR